MTRIEEQIPALVSAEWLAERQGASNLVVLDATMPKVGAADQEPQPLQIKGAIFMDLKNKWSVDTALFPNTMLEAPEFEQRARDLGLNADSVVVVYDDHGIYSSPRAWWMFRSMGHQRVAVLDGGLPGWIEAGYKTETKTLSRQTKGNFTARPSSAFFVGHEEILPKLQDKSCAILDARAAERFTGHAPEPREGLRSGHIPNSKNLPYTSILKEGKMKGPEELKSIFRDKSRGAEQMIFSCGSGITACVLALGAFLGGYDRLAVYDGSWTEWGSLEELPVERS